MFRLFKGEVMKLLKMPTVYVLTLLLAILITFSFVFFSPETRISNTYVNNVNLEQNVEQIYKKIYTDVTSTYSKEKVSEFINHSMSEKSVEDLVNYYMSKISLIDSVGNRTKSAREKTIDKFDEVAQKYITLCANFSLVENSPYFTPTSADAEQIYTALKELKELIKKDCDTKYYFPTTAYLITDSDYKAIIKEIDNQMEEISNRVRIEESGKIDVTNNIETYRILYHEIQENYFSNYAIEPVSDQQSIYKLKTQFISVSEELNLTEKILTDINNKYKVGAQDKLDRLSNDVTTYYNSLNPTSDEANTYEAKKLLLDKISLVYSTGYYANLLAKSEVVKALCQDKTDAQFNSYLGVSELNNYYNMTTFNRYNFSQNLSMYTSIYENEIIESNYGIAFSADKTSNFSINSNESATNAFDYAYWVLDIFGFIIVIFSVILASNMIAGEQKDKTMKMLAIRPFSRNQIMTAKILAVLFFALIFIVLTMLITLIIGAAMYGISSSYLIVTINASTSFLISPLVLYLIYVLCVFFKVVFFVLLAFLISTALRSYMGATVINIFFILITLVGNNFLSNIVIWKYIPFANIDLFKYFGNGTFSNSSSLFSSSYILPGTDLIFSLIISSVFMAIVTIITYSIFKKRDIT